MSRLSQSCESCEIKQDETSDKGEEVKGEIFEKRVLLLILLSIVLLVIGIAFQKNLHENPVAEYGIFLTAYLLSGTSILRKAFRNMRGGRVFDENFLMSIATLGAIAIHQMPEAVAVMVFFRTGEFLQDMAVDRSRKSIKSLLEIKPEFVNLKRGSRVQRVNPRDVEVGSLIIVKPGEKIPLDGVIVEGKATLNTSVLTGESKPKSVSVGDEVLSGMVNLDGLLTIRVVRNFENSAISKILKLVEEAGSRKAKAEKFITRFAKYYTPAVILLSLSIAVIPPIILKTPFSPWIYRALVLLVISCPCALVLSIPLSYFTSIGKSAREGILVKGANFIDSLLSARIVAFDKTGTLTKGEFRVSGIFPKNDFSKDELLEITALVEENSNHPIAKSIVDAYRATNPEFRDENLKVESYVEIAGRGLKARVNGLTVVVGNDAFMHDEKIEHEVCVSESTAVHVAVNGRYAGYIVVEDEVKEDSSKALAEIKKLGYRTVMITGDSDVIARKVAEIVGVDEFFAELLPEDKVKVIERLQKSDGVVFVGDGINDAPVIARADVGMAMGALGSDVAIEVADMVIMDDKPSKVPLAIKIARKTQRIVWQNISLALLIKGAFITLGSFGLASMWEAVVADVGVTLLAVANAMRLFR